MCCLSLLQTAGSEDAVHAQLRQNAAALDAWTMFIQPVKNCTIDAGPEGKESDEHLSKKAKTEVESLTNLSHEDSNKSDKHLPEETRKDLELLSDAFLYDENHYDRFEPEPGIKNVIQLIISDAVDLLCGKKSNEDDESKRPQEILKWAKETGEGIIEEIEFLKVESDATFYSQKYSAQNPHRRYFLSYRDRRISAMFDYDPGFDNEPKCLLEDRRSRETSSRPRHRRMEYGKGWNRCNSKTRLDISPLPLPTMFVIQRVLQTLVHLGINVEKPQWLFLHTAGTNGC